jgi:hypothetical protein
VRGWVPGCGCGVFDIPVKVIRETTKKLNPNNVRFMTVILLFNNPVDRIINC